MAKLCCSRPPASSRRARTPARSTSASSGTSCALSEDDGAEPQDRHPLPKPRVERSGVGQIRGGRPPEGVRKVVLLEVLPPPASIAAVMICMMSLSMVCFPFLFVERPCSTGQERGRREESTPLSTLFSCRFFAKAAFLWSETREMENIMNNSKKSMTAFCTAWADALPVMTFAASGVIELEIPGMNPVTALTSRPQV